MADRYTPAGTEFKPMELDEEKEAAFQEYLERKRKGRAKNPMYATSSSVVGEVPRGQEKVVKEILHQKRFTRDGKFSEQYAGAGHAKNHSLDTSVTKSRVHSAFDGIM